ncbi:Uma2 family endonuclease [Salinarimonas chemoclinalis]|uniref:Uma2 family endonuclease n=1 Tax=Salinarimonas chemoclinalis TaxID=3241599 RepID=UPI00355913E4
MAEPAPRDWTIDEFLAWQEHQPERWELVDGQPRAMAGASNVHDDIVVNILTELRRLTRGGPCRPFTGDGAVETRPGRLRRPDVGLDCGRRDPQARIAARPRLVVEVLSPSTRDFDAFEKLEEYKRVASIEAILLVEPNRPLVLAWTREGDDAWSRTTVEGPEARLDLPALDLSLPLAAIYADVAFPKEPPRVVGGT